MLPYHIIYTNIVDFVEPLEFCVIRTLLSILGFKITELYRLVMNVWTN